MIRVDGDCPDGLWSLIPGYLPRGDEFAQRASEARREEVAAPLRGRRFYRRISRAVELGDYDFRRHRYPARFEAQFGCRGGGQDVAFALGRARVEETREREGSVMAVYRNWLAADIETFIEVDEV